MNTPQLKLAANPTAIVLAIAVVLLLIGWHIVVISHRPAHFNAVVSELASIRQFKQDLTPNSTDTRLVYCQDTEEGVGMFFCITANGKSKLLCEQKEKCHTWQRFSMLGWSPDDSFFAFAFPSNPQQREEKIVICNGISGEEVARITADVNLYELAWLTPRAFAYSTSFTKDLYVVEQQSGDEWVTTRHLRGISQDKLEDLTAISQNSVAWRNDGGLWVLQLDSEHPERVWESTTNQYQLVDFTYSTQAGEFLLNCSGKEGRFLSRFSLGTQWTPNGERLRGNESSVRKATWNEHVTKYVYVDYNKGEPLFCIKAKLDLEPLREPWQGWIRNWALGSNHLYFTGCSEGGFPGIWEYDIKSQVNRCMVSSLERPLRYAVSVTPLVGVAAGALGDRTYHLWQPRRVSPKKKYPVIITRDFSNWFPYAQVAANGGFYFAIVDESCVMSFCEILAKNPNVDTNRMYLYASNIGSSFVMELMAKKTGYGKVRFCSTQFLCPIYPPCPKRKCSLQAAGMTNGFQLKS